jgi:hypothetical protein
MGRNSIELMTADDIADELNRRNIRFALVVEHEDGAIAMLADGYSEPSTTLIGAMEQLKHNLLAGSK